MECYISFKEQVIDMLFKEVQQEENDIKLSQFILHYPKTLIQNLRTFKKRNHKCINAK